MHRMLRHTARRAMACALLACLFLAAPALAARHVLRAPDAGDLVATRTVALPAPATPMEHAPVRFAWRLDPDAALEAPAPFVASSREYWQTVDGAELRRGVAIATSAPGALLRISPARGAKPVSPEGIRVSGNGRTVPLATRVDARALQAAGMPVGSGMAAVRLDPAAGAGTYSLQVPDAEGRYVVHVFEPDSRIVLSASLDRDQVLAGGDTRVSLVMTDGDRRLRHVTAEGLLVAPDGTSWPLRLRAGADGALRGRVPVPPDARGGPGLWEVQVFAGDGRIQRDARTAFAVGQPTARLAGGFAFDATRLQLRLPLEVGSPGRYEARGTLYATGRDGVLRPVAIAHSADWLVPGAASLALDFPRDALPGGYGAPYELRDLELNDQSRLAPLERRRRAARMER